jgi:hypothetical protein
MEKLKKIIEESVGYVIEGIGSVPGGLKDANGKDIVTGRMVRPADKADKRWGQIKNVTIDLKVTIEWMDQESKYQGKTKTAEDPKAIAIY